MSDYVPCKIWTNDAGDPPPTADWESPYAMWLVEIFNATKVRPLPKAIRTNSTRELRKLCAFCRELEKATKSDSFALSAGRAGYLIGSTTERASDLLRILIRRGVLVRTERGRGGCPNRYRYSGDSTPSKKRQLATEVNQ